MPLLNSVNQTIHAAVQTPSDLANSAWVNRLKPRSAASRTTLLVMLIVLFSLGMSLWFFWRTFYTPEIRQHARYLAANITLVQNARVSILSEQKPIFISQWLKQTMGIELVSNPALLPDIQDKIIAEIFTNRLESYLAQELHVPRHHVRVYFKFKPTPELWVYTPQLGQSWLREPLPTYTNYSIELLLAWLIGTPLLTALTILTLVRQLDRPLRRLQQAANSYSKTGNAPYLATSHGPLEIRQVNASFNQMVAHLQQIEQDRQLMLAGISHDLRTPLTRIRLTAEMLPDEFLKEGLIYDVDDMDAILGQFISYMRDGSDEQPQPTQINDLLNEVVVQFQPLHVQFQPQPLPVIRARSLSLKRLIANLVNNAKKYGATPIELEAYHSGKHITICVRDHGAGIAEHDIETIMQPFVRGESARTIQGSGLGLAIVKRIVDIHQGELKIDNHPQGGLQVTVVLPVNPTD